MSIRPLNPLDVPRYMLLGGPRRVDRAHPLNRVSSNPGSRLPLTEATKLSLPVQRNGLCAWTWTQGKQVLGIAVATPRSGRRSWEVSHLLLSSEDDIPNGELLRSLCQSVARQGGERVFIRLRTDDPLVRSATAHGFTPCQQELLYIGAQRKGAGDGSAELYKKSPAHEYGVYRLYNATVPSSARFALGMTFDQWSSSRERNRGREYVWVNDDSVRGWVRTVQRLGGGGLMMMVHPEYETETSAILQSGLTYLSRTKAAWLLVPEHQILLQRLLDQKGFRLASEYVTLVRSMVAPVSKEKVPRAVTIPSI